MEMQIRRSDRAISTDEARGILDKGEYGILSTVSADGQPYGVPVSYVCKGDIIYFHCAPKGHKLDNLGANSRVSFCVVGKTELLPAEYGTKYESAIVSGRALEVHGDEKRDGLLELIRKYALDYVDKAPQHIAADGGKTRVFKIVVEAVTGKSRK